MLIKCRKCKVKRRDEIKKCPVCNKPEEKYVQVKWKKQRKRLWEKQDLTEFINMIPPNTEGRKKEAVEIKRVFIIQLREKYKLSFSKIGRILGYKDHTTALYHYKK